ncbi:hypothetical protein COBT_002974 [Conglomerata obtusa]
MFHLIYISSVLSSQDDTYDNTLFLQHCNTIMNAAQEILKKQHDIRTGYKLSVLKLNKDIIAFNISLERMAVKLMNYSYLCNVYRKTKNVSMFRYCSGLKSKLKAEYYQKRIEIGNIKRQHLIAQKNFTRENELFEVYKNEYNNFIKTYIDLNHNDIKTEKKHKIETEKDKNTA